MPIDEVSTPCMKRYLNICGERINSQPSKCFGYEFAKIAKSLAKLHL
jgi:hypothetical protein